MENGSLRNIQDGRTLAEAVNQRPGRMIQLASLLYCQAAEPIHYAEGISITTVESGLLFYIANNPGVTNAVLAKQFGRTKGATSQIIKKLESSGLIIREQNPKDAKSFNLYPSLEANKIIQAINEYDLTNPNSMLQRLFEQCSISDIQTFFRMVDLYSALLIQSFDDAKAEKGQNEKHDR